jgi:hypothetical protein
MTRTRPAEFQFAAEKSFGALSNGPGVSALRILKIAAWCEGSLTQCPEADGPNRRSGWQGIPRRFSATSRRTKTPVLEGRTIRPSRCAAQASFTAWMRALLVIRSSSVR